MAQVRGKVIEIDRGWSLILRNALASGPKEARVGILEGSIAAGPAPGVPLDQQKKTRKSAKTSSADRAPDEKTVPGASYAQIAFWHEYGTSKMPARPFMRRAFDENVAKYERMMQLGASDIARGRGTPAQVLTEVALANQKDVKLSIRDAKTWADPLAPSTIEKKGSTSPLIDTGAMRNAVAWEVR